MQRLFNFIKQFLKYFFSKLIGLTSIFLFLSVVVFGREGMWMPQLLKELNEKEMKSMGMKLSAEDIFSINHSSLKDAIVQFGGGCTGEIVSAKGLLITNHHCGFSQIQSLSTIEKNYLKDGFWANDFEDEIPCPGLTVTFIREISDVTEIILKDIDDTLNEESRVALIRSRSDSIEKSIPISRKGIVRAFYYGNKYYFFNTEVFTDIRFVGAPPQDIGKFGGETDNWMWPRHTGDFSLFRIYADKDNLPAVFSPENVPYKPLQSLKLSIKGVKENDFVFVFGFPGRTSEYLLSPGLDLIENQTNPNRIAIRENRLDVLREEMAKNDTVKLQYAAKFSTLENAYKKWKGEEICFNRFDVLNKKREEEKQVIEKFKKNSQLISDTTIVDEYRLINRKTKELNYANDFYADAFSGIEFLSVWNSFKPLVKLYNDKSSSDSAIKVEADRLLKGMRWFYKSSSVAVDKKVCQSIFTLANTKLDRKFLPQKFNEAGRSQDHLTEFINKLYKNSIVVDSSKTIDLLAKLRKKDITKFIKDPFYQLNNDFSVIFSGITPQLTSLNRELNVVQRRWMHDLLKLDTKNKLFPDANSTLRISYGKIERMKPYDGVLYDYFSTASGILEKYMIDPLNYPVSSRLEALIRTKDFGAYGKNGVLTVNFIASTHTTGGNSGSPCINAKGELIGVNFDRVWEGVSSDYYYVDDYSRNVCVDIRYILFIIDKFGNAERLIKEMNIVKN